MVILFKKIPPGYLLLLVTIVSVDYHIVHFNPVSSYRTLSSSF